MQMQSAKRPKDTGCSRACWQKQGHRRAFGLIWNALSWVSDTAGRHQRPYRRYWVMILHDAELPLNNKQGSFLTLETTLWWVKLWRRCYSWKLGINWWKLWQEAESSSNYENYMTKYRWLCSRTTHVLVQDWFLFQNHFKSLLQTLNV